VTPTPHPTHAADHDLPRWAVLVDAEQVSLHDEHGEIVMWTLDEVREDPTVGLVIANALKMFYEHGPGMVRASIGRPPPEGGHAPQLLGVSFAAYRSPADGTAVVHVDTPGVAEDADGPRIRLYVNDDPVIENPPYPDGLQVTCPLCGTTTPAAGDGSTPRSCPHCQAVLEDPQGRREATIARAARAGR
jgi:ribosomal protein S27E